MSYWFFETEYLSNEYRLRDIWTHDSLIDDQQTIGKIGYILNI